jgi:hypothetical protein
MLVRPIIGSWEPKNIERIVSWESRRLAVLPSPGLSGDLHQDLGRGALTVQITGSLSTDELRDEFLKEVREKFLAGEPVDFLADIVKESELEQVLIEALDFEERAGDPDQFRYRIVLREYTEPPEPPGLGDDFGLDVDADLGLDVDLGLDLLDIPGLMPDMPEIGDLLSPIKPAAEELKNTLSKAASVLDPLKELLG